MKLGAARLVGSLAFLICWAGLGGPSAFGQKSLQLHHDAIVLQPRAADSSLKCYCPTPSRQNLLDLHRETPYGLATSSMAIPRPPKVLRVLGIRVDFPVEDPDDPMTTGTGRFDLRDTTEYFRNTGHHFDSAPHDRAYFEAHMRALDAFWNTVSNGQLELQWEVYPRDPDSAYPMPQKMYFYGGIPDSILKAVPDSLKSRVRDSIIASGLRRFVLDAGASASGNEDALRFSDYNAVIIFHAGSDRQSDIFLDSPADLFTGFLRLDSTLYLHGGSDSLVEAIIMPETAVQDGRISVLNGVMAHEFGHQLGLVDLYNTRNFMTQVGNFSLMDNNAADVGVQTVVSDQERTIYGALPVYPDAWSRAYLDFVTVTELTNANGVHVPAAELLEPVPQSFSQVVRVPISSTEYYLLENRRIDVDQRGDPALRFDSATYVILGPMDSLTRVNTREYDFLQPGNGMLIWHVDEGVAALDYATGDDIPNNFLANTLQWDWRRRFIRLIEADGIVHFGGFYSSGTGEIGDYFYLHNKGEFSETTNPPAISNTGGSTGIRIFRISDPSADMTFNVTTTGRLPGFPVFAGREDGLVGAPMITDIIQTPGHEWKIQGDGRPEIFAGYRNYVLAWSWDGTPLGGLQVKDTVASFDTSLVIDSFQVVAMAAPDESGWMAPPFIGDFDGDEGFADLVGVTRTGHVYVWRMFDGNGDGLFDLKFDTVTSAAPAAAPVIWNQGTTTNFTKLIIPVESGGYDEVSLATGHRVARAFPGTIRGIAGSSELDGVAVWRDEAAHWVIGSVADPSHQALVGSDSLLAPVLGDVDGDSVLDAVVVDVAGRLGVWETEAFAILPGFPANLGAAPAAPPVLADVDRDGYLDIITTGGGRLHATSRNGALLPNFPVVIGRVNAPDSTAASPVVTDMGNEGLLGILLGGETRAIYGFNGNGSTLSTFPRPLGDRLSTPAAVASNVVDHQSAVFARADDGYLYGYEVAQAATPSRAIWPMAFRDTRHTSTLPVEDLDTRKIYTQFFIPERAFVYPNPAQDRAIVRYWLGGQAQVHIKIFDLAGNLVKEAEGPGVGGAYNEWTWTCQGAASGVYFAHLEVVETSGGHRETALCKMAIVQ